LGKETRWGVERKGENGTGRPSKKGGGGGEGQKMRGQKIAKGNTTPAKLKEGVP